jgi:hypothetical protein
MGTDMTGSIASYILIYMEEKSKHFVLFSKKI